MLKQIQDSKEFCSSTITLSVDNFSDFEDLYSYEKECVAVGGRNKNVEIDPDIDSKNTVSTKTDSDQNSFLAIDPINKTINDLTIFDVYNKVKEKIKGQDEAVFKIVNAIFKHYFATVLLDRDEAIEIKNNILLIGNTGTGKTRILEEISKILKVPFVRENMMRFTRAGIVGASVEDIFADLIQVSGNDVQKAELGIVFLDEFDKLSSIGTREYDAGLDVQRSLLAPLEGEVINSTVGIQRTLIGQRSFTLDTSKIIFIAGGAFEGLDKIKKNRINLRRTGGKMGFGTEVVYDELMENYSIADLEKYGFERQILARFPTIVNLDDIRKETAIEIINSIKGYVSISIKYYEKMGIKFTIREEFIDELASKVVISKINARAIRLVFSEILSEIDSYIVDKDIERIIINSSSDIIYQKKVIETVK